MCPLNSSSELARLCGAEDQPGDGRIRGLEEKHASFATAKALSTIGVSRSAARSGMSKRQGRRSDDIACVHSGRT